MFFKPFSIFICLLLSNTTIADIRNINKINDAGGTLLTIAIQQGKTLEVKRLLNAHANVNKANTSGNTPIQLAAINGKVEIFKLLLSAGANIHKHRLYRPNTLQYASREGHIEIVRLLIATGEYLEYGNAIATASANKHFSIVKLLLTVNGNSSLSSIVSSVANKNDVKLLKLLLARKVYMSLVERAYRSTPLFDAAESGHTEIVRLLLTGGAEVDIANTFGEEPGGGRTPLYIAAEKGHIAIVKLLLAANANINMSLEMGKSPLDNVVSKKGNSQVIALLLKAKIKQGFIANELSELISIATSVKNHALFKKLKHYQKRCKKC
ncbi:hypothetical protein MNBD_GAMMA12-3493 [hydrothermal vent metagenome]|uniref:Uncharacterized protein n=1 Tax=hydrothermal vent metagenome TaxID=652676 RepID=A0A3B0YF11_9ZZZZ